MPVELSIVIPLYKMAASVGLIEAHLLPVVRSITSEFEVLLVDDGSPDETWEEISKASKGNGYLRGLKLARNFGQQIAVSAGIAKTRGRFIIVMDGDMQNPPDALPRLVDKLREGYDIVYTVSRIRNNWRDELTSRTFWLLLTKFLRVDIVENQLMLRGMSRRFVAVYNGYTETTRTVAAICRDIGFKSTVIEVVNKRRDVGRSGYNFYKRFNLMIDMIISITTAPLHLLIYVSLVVLLITAIGSIYYIFRIIFNEVPPGYTSIILSIFFFGSLITLILGVIGLYLANIYAEVRRRPLYLIEEEVGVDRSEYDH